MDAALELERTPTPRIELPRPQVIPNAQAVDLMMLAEVSSQQSHDINLRHAPRPYHGPQDEEPQPPRVVTPLIKHELTRQMSPVDAPDIIPLPSQAAHSSPVKASPAAVQQNNRTPHSDPNGIPLIPRDTQPARVSTHRIMDILNNDQDVPVFRQRESQPPQSQAQEPSTPSRRESAVSQHNTPSHDAAPTLDAAVDDEQPVDQALMDALGGRPSVPPSPPPAPPAHHQSWARPSAPPARESEDAPRRKDPLQKIRELLDRKARELGREPPDRSQYRFAGRLTSYLPRVSSMQAAQDQQDVAGYDPTRPSAGLYGSSSSAAPSYPTGSRRESQDHGVSHWDREGRMSGSQAPQQPHQSPYNNPSQLHHGNHNQAASTSSAHQSPYSLPAGALPLPPKPPGPPPPVNFRFAHYDPAPPRPSYPPTSPTYPPGSHPPSLGPPPPSHYPPSYHPPYQGSYVPPPGSFQAPPPPPSNLASYPPLKIHQYGGQPILPANMAPPPHLGPQMPYLGQQQGPPPPPSAYSPPQSQQQQQHQQQQPTVLTVPIPQYERPRGDEAREQRPEPQQRPRRQYRSYHAPGTQFRTYQGPKQGPRREN
jgi:hypothetical protein